MPNVAKKSLAIATLATVLVTSLVGREAMAAPGDTLFYDDLNGNLNAFTIVSSGGDASTGTETSSQGQSLRLRWDTVSIFTDPIAAAVPGAELSLWIRRGDNSFSNYPETGEDLVIEYRDAGANWNLIDTIPGGGTGGEILTPTYTLPAAALHASLSIRLTLTSGNGNDFDYYHIDDWTVTETAGPGSPTLAPGSCDDFESGSSGWIINETGGEAGISGLTANSPSNSLYTREGPVTVTSVAIDLSAESLLSLDIWVRRGSDAFSENPDNNEDLVVEYRTSGGSWSVLETFAGGGTQGEIFVRSYPLPNDALHAAFQIRVRQTAGNGNNTDYWHVDDVCLTSSQPVLYSFEEASWTGASGEVLDTNGSGFDGTVFGGAQNDDLNPALATNPGTCLYGDFDGIDDYIEIADDPGLDFLNQLTVAVWINMRSLPTELHTIVSKDTNYEFHIDNAGQVYWWWQADNFRTTGFSISLNTWHHIAITYESGNQVIYVDGVPRATNNYVGTLPQNDLPLFIGTDYNLLSRAFDGLIDEVYIVPTALSQAQVQTVMNATHDCATAAAQFTLNHDNFGIHCAPETVIVDVIDSVAGTPLTSYNAQVVLDTQSGNGSWSLVAGGGTLTDATPDDGLATYDWPLGETQAQFELYYPHGTAAIDIDVWQQSDPGIRDTDAEGLLQFSVSGFTFTAAPLANPVPPVITTFDDTQVAATLFDVHVAAYGQTANDPTCGVIESYAGNQTLKFWSTYQNPNTGTRSVEVDGINGGASLLAVATNEGAAVNQNVTFTNGQAQLVVRYKDVGLMQLAAKDDTLSHPDLPTGIRGGTGDFVSKPATFVVSDIRDDTGALLNPQAPDATGPVFIAAGAPFRATVTALDADGEPTPNYGREQAPLGPDTVRLDPVLVAPIAGNAGGIAQGSGFGAFVGGVATGTEFSWSEVGVMQLEPSVGDGDYLGAGNVTGNLSVNVGRFIPDHFELALTEPELITQCGPGAFTYTGQPFDYATTPSITATAKNLAGATTTNYRQDLVDPTQNFFRIAHSTLGARQYTVTAGTLNLSSLPPASSDPAVSYAGPGIAQIDFGGGGLLFDRGVPEAPFDAEIGLSIDVLDADGVGNGVGGAPDTTTAFGGSPDFFIDFDNGVEIRYGRVSFQNAYGSELLDLPVPLRAEYYASAVIGFVPNTVDDCSDNIDLAFSGFTDDLNLGDTCALDNGAPGDSNVGCAAPAPLMLQYSEPPAGGDFNLTLSAPGAGNSGSLTISASVPDWLKFDWDQAAPGDEDPTGQATFGLFKGDGAQIYTREIY